MTAVTPREVEAYLAKPNPAHAIILVFGEDTGLVRERADALIASAVDDVNDPFSLVRLDGDDLASEPSRLIDEALTVPLFGGRRAIRVRAGARSFASAVEILVNEPPKDCRIVIEAGELRRDAALRVLCEKARTAGVIACYADSDEGLAGLIDSELKAATLGITPDARAALIDLIGGDRLASRNEIRKLMLYAHGKSEITLDNVVAVVTDASDLALDPVIDNAFAGRPAEFETHCSRMLSSGTNPNSIMFAAQRQAGLLHRARLVVDQGQSPQSAFDRAIPKWHFSREPLVLRALELSSSERLRQNMIQLGDATLELRRQTQLAAVIAQRVLMAIAVNARRKG